MRHRNTKGGRRRVPSGCQPIRSSFQEIVAGYDFANFTFDDFVAWIAQRRGRPIEFIAASLDTTGLTGFWFTHKKLDYVVYERDTLPLHQFHIQLHELAHMLCGHRTLEVTDADLWMLRLDLVRTRSLSQRNPQEEMEAEVLASLIFEQIQRHHRRKALTTIPSSPSGAAAYWRALENL